MDSRLNAFLERADAVLARIEPLLPTPRQAIDWTNCLAARWQREGRSGFLLPLEVSLDMRLSDLIRCRPPSRTVGAQHSTVS